MEERLRSHYESLSRAIAFTRSADTKATPLLALQIALSGTLASRFDVLLGSLLHGTSDFQQVVLVTLLTVYVVCLMLVIILGTMVYIPASPRTGKSLIFFEDIKALSFESFHRQSTALNADEIEKQLLDQIHRVSTIASVKMQRVRQAFWITMPSLLSWAILLAWGSVPPSPGPS